MGTTKVYNVEDIRKMTKTIDSNPALNRQVARWHNNADMTQKESAQKRMRMLVKELSQNETVTVVCNPDGKVIIGITLLVKDGFYGAAERRLVFQL